MPKTTKAETVTLDVRRLRAEILGGFARLAKELLKTSSTNKSVFLACSQFYCDEAYDAVHDSVVVSKSLVLAKAKPVSYTVGWKHLAWDSNFSGIVGFQAMCNEEGWSEAAGDDGGWDDEAAGSSSSPVAVALRTSEGVRLVWLGALQRPWLDFPDAAQNREDCQNVAVVRDPAPMKLVGEEKALYAQVLATPADLGVRDVLRDAWMQRNDVRGELAALSTAPKLTDKARARAAEIVLEHGRAWLGPLQAVVPLSGALFGPGPFARKLVVFAKDAKAFGKVASAPEWATVESIEFANQSHRQVTPAMKNLRAVGPLEGKQLAPFAKGTWLVEDLDVEDTGGTLAALAKLTLPLVTLRVRSEAPDLGALAKASWWPKLRRLEIWLPGDTEEAALAIQTVFGAHAGAIPSGCELAVGKLSAGQRGGWVLAGTAKKQRLELVRPDCNMELGDQLAKQTKLKLPATWTPDDDDWFTFGFGASAATPSGVRTS